MIFVVRLALHFELVSASDKDTPLNKLFENQNIFFRGLLLGISSLLHVILGLTEFGSYDSQSEVHQEECTHEDYHDEEYGHVGLKRESRGI